MSSEGFLETVGGDPDPQRELFTTTGGETTGDDDEDFEETMSNDEDNDEEGNTDEEGSVGKPKEDFMMWGGDVDDDSPPTPTFGGLMRIKNPKKGCDDEIFAWSGTDPDTPKVMMYSWSVSAKGWTLPKSQFKKGGTKIQGPTREGMYRPRGVKQERTTKENCSTYSGTDTFNGINPSDGKISIPIITYKDVTRKHMIDHGMIDVFLLKDPRNKKTVRDLFRHHAMMPVEWVKQEVKRLRGFNDIYIDQNLKWSAQYIRNSVNADMLTKLLHEVTLETSGPETFVALMRIVHSDSYEALEKVKDKLLDLSLKDFPGEDVRALNVKIKQYAEHLECGDHFTEELIPKICLKYENAADTKFSQWATTNLYEPALKQVKDLRVMHKRALSYKPLTVETICRKTNTRYDDAIAAGRYTTAVTTKEPDALPAGYLAKIQEEVAKSLKQVNFADKSGKGTGGGGTRGTGEAGGSDKDLSVITVNGTEYPYKSNTWKTVVPAGTQEKQIRHGSQRYRYCTDCNRWCYHYGGADHQKYLARKNASGATPAPADATPAPTPEVAATPVAHLAMIANDADDWQWGFAGLNL